ncbi:MAG: O-antigen ligase family protein [Candidatus Moraniibacteriota bacterium]
MKHNFSSSLKKKDFPLILLVAVLLSGGIIGALVFDFSILIPIAVAGAFFFTLLFWRDPLMFLVCIIPFRMVFDFSGEFFFVRITDSLSLSLSQVIGVFVFGIGVLFFIKYFQRAAGSLKVMLPFWVLLAWAAASFFFSFSPSDTARDVLRVFDILALASMAFVFTQSRSDMKLILLAMLYSSVVPMLFGIWQYISGVGYSEEFTDIQRIYGTFGHPNVFGMYLFILIVFCFFFWKFFADTIRERIFALGLGVIAFFLIFLTLSRVSWAILFLFFFVLGALRFRKMVVPVVLIAMAVFLLVPSVQDRIMELFTFSADSSVLWRINIWKDATDQVFVWNKVWLGFGLDTFPVVVSEIHAASFGSDNAHNDFVKFFVEGGIVGLLVYIFWLGSFSVLFFRESVRKNLEMKDQELFLFVLILLLSLVVASLSDAVFKSTPLQWLLWIFAGALLGLTQKEKYAKV